MVVLRSKNEISGLRRAGELVARALVLLRPHVRAGVRLAELDRITEEFIGCEDGEPTYKGYRPSPSVRPFPGTICPAVTEEVVRGIPGSPRRDQGSASVTSERPPRNSRSPTVTALSGNWATTASATRCTRSPT